MFADLIKWLASGIAAVIAVILVIGITVASAGVTGLLGIVTLLVIVAVLIKEYLDQEPKQQARINLLAQGERTGRNAVAGCVTSTII